MFARFGAASILCFLADVQAWGDDAESPTLWNRDFLLGGLHGLRDNAEESGLTVEFVYTAEYFRNLDGGIKRGGDYRADASLTLELQTDKAGWWKNGTFFAHVQGQHGDGITEDQVGDFQVLSNIDADDYFQVSEFWYKHRFLDGKLWLKLGKQESNEDFAFVEYGGEFINSSPGFSPTIPLVTYPDQDWGVVLGVEPVEWFSINIGVYQGRPDGGRSIGNTIDNLRGPMVMVEPAFHYAIRGKEGHIRLGYWWNGDAFERLAPEEDESPFSAPEDMLALVSDVRDRGLAAAFLSGLFGFGQEWVTAWAVERILGGDAVDDNTYGFYLTWDQEVYVENSDDPEDEQGIGIFAQYGWSDDNLFEAEQYYGLGMQWTGAIPTRNDDIFGVGVFHVLLSNEAGFEKRHETVIELYYKAQLTPWLSLKPDLQYITNPGGTKNDDAWVVGLRMEISF